MTIDDPRLPPPYEPPEEDADAPSSTGPAHSRGRLWGALLGVVGVGFVALVVSSARNGSVPVGASGSMSGMSMSGDGGMSMTMRDIDGRRVSIPGGEPGVAVFVNARDCPSCVTAVRTASRALRASGRRARLLVVAIDAGTSRDDLARFARAANAPQARYVVDDRNSGLASMFDASGVGAAVVYDRSGRVVDHPAGGRSKLQRSLSRAR